MADSPTALEGAHAAAIELLREIDRCEEHLRDPDRWEAFRQLAVEEGECDPGDWWVLLGLGYGLAYCDPGDWWAELRRRKESLGAAIDQTEVRWKEIADDLARIHGAKGFKRDGQLRTSCTHWLLDRAASTYFDAGYLLSIAEDASPAGRDHLLSENRLADLPPLDFLSLQAALDSEYISGDATAALSTSTEPADEAVKEKPPADERELDPRDRRILEAMLILGATSSDNRKTQDEIAQAAIYSRADRDAVKDRILQLKRMGFVETKGSRGGGCWLTAKGIKSAEIGRTDSRPNAH